MGIFAELDVGHPTASLDSIANLAGDDIRSDRSTDDRRQVGPLATRQTESGVALACDSDSLPRFRTRVQDATSPR